MVQRGYIFKSLSYNGKPTGIYYGVLSLIQSIRKAYPKSIIHIVRDGKPLAKRKLYPSYKAQRDEVDYKPANDLNLIKNLQKMLATYKGVYIWYDLEYEADDMIASLSLRKPEESIILSGDNDFLQLMCKGVSISKTIKEGKFELRTADYIKQKYGCTPAQLLTFRALQGDKSDNITGVIPTRKIKSLINKKPDEIISALTEEEKTNFKRNLVLMSLKQFQKHPIHKKPLQIEPDKSLFTVFGLERFMEV